METSKRMRHETQQHQATSRKKQRHSRAAMTEIGLPVGKPITIGGLNQHTYLIEPVTGSDHEVFLLNVDTHDRLKCGPRRNIKNLGGKGAYSKWQVTGNSNDGYSLQNVGHRDNGESLYLGTSDGSFVALNDPQPMTIEPVSEDQQADYASTFTDYELSEEERKAFVETGVLRIPGLVDQEVVDKALMNINEALGMAWASDNSTGDRKDHEIPGVRDLFFKTPLLGVLEQILGKGNVKLHQGGQVPLRFPNNRVPEEKSWHIDGSGSTHMNPFQVLVGIALSPQPMDDCGNLVVFPGKHVDSHEAVAQMRKKRDATGSKKPGWLGYRLNLTDDDSFQVKLEPGDVVLAHQKMPHRVAHNSSPNIRYMIYFRIKHKKHDENDDLGGLWFRFEGLQDMAASCSAEETA